MAKDKITEYDATANNNTVCGDVNIAENSALPSDMNNFAREIMSHLKEGLGSGTPLYVDQTNNRLGINTSSPSVDLEISGGLSVDGGTIKLDGNYPVGTGNVALGNTALDSGSLSGANNTAIGFASLTTNTSGAGNTSVGSGSMNSTTTGSDNISMGVSALYNNTTGSYNTALGRSALVSNTTASNNTAVGYQSAYTNTTGGQFTAIGRQALYANTTGIYSVALGSNSLFANTTGGYNTAIGTFALQNNSTASNNTAVGYQALYSTQDIGNNVAIGYRAGYTFNGDYGYNTIVGYQAGYSLSGTTGGYGNTLIGSSGTTGRGAGYYITTGTLNTIIGGYDGNQGGLDIRTSSNNIVLSDGDGQIRFVSNASGDVLLAKVTTATTTRGIRIDNNGKIYNAQPNGAQAQLFYATSTGNQVGAIQLTTTSTSFNTSSDHRLKESVSYDFDATTRLKQLKPCRFNFIADADKTVDGFLAHEVQSVVPEAITGTHNEVDDDGNPVYQGIDQSKLVPLLVKTIQELEARIVALENA